MSDERPSAPAPLVRTDAWEDLRALTPARIALGRAGAALPTREVLAFDLDHAQAREAVHTPLDLARLGADLEAAGWPWLELASRAPDRRTYLMRPDLGRRLAPDALARLAAYRGCTLALVIADGLSSRAVQQHAVPLLAALRGLLDPGWRLAPVCVVGQGRVAVGDETGEALGAEIVAVLIGERPGLKAPDSLGVYLTFRPRLGRTDAERNCISNIRPEGLPVEQAAHRLVWHLREALRLGLSGIGLKDESDLVLLPPS